MTRLRANLLLLCAGAIWGMGFVAQSTAMSSIGPLLFVGLRFALATLVICPFAVIEARRAPAALTWRQGRWFVMIGLLLFAGMLAQQFGLLTTSVTNSGFLTGLYVVMVPFIGVAVFRQWPHPVVWPGSAMALTGILMLSGGRIGALGVGDWLTILCAAFWAMQVFLIARHAADSARPVTLAVTQFAVCGTAALVAALAFEPFDLAAIREAAPELLFSGILSGGVAFTLQVIGQRHTTAPQAAIFLSTEAVFAALFAAIFLGERMSAMGLAGCGLIFAAILLVEIVPSLRGKARVSP